MFGSLVFFGFYQEWFSGILLALVSVLPWISLLLSLPGMLKVKASLRCPPRARQGMPVRPMLKLSGFFLMPPVRCTIRVVNHLTGERYLGKPGEMLPTEHCGMFTISYPTLYVYDFLGLFRRQLKREETCTLYLEPKPVPSRRLPRPNKKGDGILRPKPGGGFSEIHDLRLYRPGDNLRQIHWKMSAKTGKLIYREPMEPVRRGYTLTLTLSGTPNVLDVKLGQLLWTSQRLLEKQIEHEVRCQTGTGVLRFQVTDEATLETGLHMILAAAPAGGSAVPDTGDAAWNYHVGGGDDEA